MKAQRKKNRNLKKAVKDREQCRQGNNLETKGLLAITNMSELLGNIGNLAGEALTEGDVDICHRFIFNVFQGKHL